MAPPPTPPLVLTERVRRLCRLAPADAAFLALHYPTRFELTPAGRRDVYAVTPAGVVGVVLTPTRRLIIRPKIPLANLFYLLDPLCPQPQDVDCTTPADGCEALDFLAGQFALRLRECVNAGLARGYAEREAAGPFLVGRLDVAAQMRDAGTHKERLHCRHDAFTADVLCNRAVRSVAEVVLASPLLRSDTRTALQATLPGFAEVQTVDLSEEVWSALENAPAAYRPVLNLGRLLAGSLRAGDVAGDVAGPAFLLHLEQVFEQFLTRLLQRATESEGQGRTRCRIVPQPSVRANIPVAGQPDLHVRPDVLLLHGDATRLIVDAKWKRLGASPLVIADVYQMLAYCTALGVGRAVLIYPGRRDCVWHYRLERADCRVSIYRMRVVGDRAALDRSVRRLTRFLLP